MTDDQNKTTQTDWTQLAKDALDIWQNHLTSLATDPKAKEEMARFVTPMTEAMAGWSSVVQQGMHQMMKMAAAAAEQTQAYSAQAEDQAEEPAEDQAEAAPEAEVSEASVAPTPEPQAAPEQDESDQQVVTEETVQHDEPAAPPAAMDEPAGAEQPAQPVLDAPAGEPRAESAPESGRTLAPDGTRSLAELAGRLAVLERELDHLRPRTRRKDAAAEPVADGADEPMAGAHQEANTP